ncbi:MAG: hypothetical protein D6725_02510 [Planctomycetota bacterium]|nr:MAG: hypothetical protein D6725_02510 [Planctomycetota bacterium]
MARALIALTPFACVAAAALLCTGRDRAIRDRRRPAGVFGGTCADSSAQHVRPDGNASRRLLSVLISGLIAVAVLAAWGGPWPRDAARSIACGGVLVDAQSGLLARVAALLLAAWALGPGRGVLWETVARDQRRGGADEARSARRDGNEDVAREIRTGVEAGVLWAFAGALLAAVADAWWVMVVAVECLAAGLASYTRGGAEPGRETASADGGWGSAWRPLFAAQSFGSVLLVSGLAVSYALGGVSAFSDLPWAVARATGRPLPAHPLARPLAVCGLVLALGGLGLKLGFAPFHAAHDRPLRARRMAERVLLSPLGLIVGSSVCLRLAYGLDVLTGRQAAAVFAVLAVFSFVLPTCWACLKDDLLERWRGIVLAHWGCVFAGAFLTVLPPTSGEPLMGGRLPGSWPHPALVDGRPFRGIRWAAVPSASPSGGKGTSRAGDGTADAAGSLVVASDVSAVGLVVGLALLNLAVAGVLLGAAQRGREDRPGGVGRAVLPAGKGVTAAPEGGDRWRIFGTSVAWLTLAGIPPTLGCWPRLLQGVQLLTAAHESDFADIPAPAPLALLVALAAGFHACVLCWLAAQWICGVAMRRPVRRLDVSRPDSADLLIVVAGVVVFLGGVALIRGGPLLRLW